MGRWIAGAAAIGLAGGLAAQSAGMFEMTPPARWSAEPETEELCKAIRAECPGMYPDGNIDATMAFDELYDHKGMLAGMRLVTSTGCKPLDESVMLGRKEFRQGFEKDGRSYEGVQLELRPGIDPTGIRVVKRTDNMQIGMGCS